MLKVPGVPQCICLANIQQPSSTKKAGCESDLFLLINQTTNNQNDNQQHLRYSYPNRIFPNIHRVNNLCLCKAFSIPQNSL